MAGGVLFGCNYRPNGSEHDDGPAIRVIRDGGPIGGTGQVVLQGDQCKTVDDVGVSSSWHQYLVLSHQRFRPAVCHGRMCQIWKKNCTSRFFALQHPFYQRFTNIGESQTCKIYTDGRNSFGGWMRTISLTIWKIVGENLAVLSMVLNHRIWLNSNRIAHWSQMDRWAIFCKKHVFCNRKRMGCVGYFLLKFMNHFYTDVYSTI